MVAVSEDGVGGTELDSLSNPIVIIIEYSAVIVRGCVACSCSCFKRLNSVTVERIIQLVF